MTRLYLDFLHPRRRRSPVGIALLFAGLVSLMAAIGQHVLLESQTTALRKRVDTAVSMERRHRGPLQPASPADARANAQALAAANQVLTSLNQPWSALFAELEAVATPSVALLSIQPEADGKRVLIGGEAKRYEQVLDYVGRLEATAGFANVFLVSHGRRESAKGAAVVFLLNADWVGQP
jgi:Tfp pilus assembly protein PilN